MKKLNKKKSRKLQKNMQEISKRLIKLGVMVIPMPVTYNEEIMHLLDEQERRINICYSRHIKQHEK